MAAIETLILANHAEVQNGLLYVSGGGWSDHFRPMRPEGPAPTHFSVAIAVSIPWNETNTQHDLAVDLEDEDGQTLTQALAQLTVGRPPTLPPGSDQLASMAFTFDLGFGKSGTYRIVVNLGESRRVATFRVHDTPSQMIAA